MLAKLAEAIRRFHELELEVAHAGFRKEEKLMSDAFIAAENQKNGLITQQDGEAKVVTKKNLKELKFAIREFYLSLVLIQNFQVGIFFVPCTILLSSFSA